MVSMLPGDHVLGPLAPLPHVRIIERPAAYWLGETLRVLLVPFRPGPGKDWLEEGIKAAIENPIDAPEEHKHSPSFRTALGIHLGIENDDTPPFLRGAPDSIRAEELARLMDRYDIDFALSGNWHGRLVEEIWTEAAELGEKGAGKVRWIMQVGTTAPTGWDNPSSGSIGEILHGADGYGTLAVLDIAKNPKGVLSYAVIPGPRFIKSAAPDDLDDVLDALSPDLVQKGWRFYIRRLCDKPEELAGDSTVLRAAKESGKLAGFDVALDRSEVQSKLRRAAHEARRASTVDEAVHRYIERMPIDASRGISRDEVRALVQDVLKE
jgi:hypothetical protein